MPPALFIWFMQKRTKARTVLARQVCRLHTTGAPASLRQRLDRTWAARWVWADRRWGGAHVW